MHKSDVFPKSWIKKVHSGYPVRSAVTNVDKCPLQRVCVLLFPLWWWSSDKLELFRQEWLKEFMSNKVIWGVASPVSMIRQTHFQATEFTALIQSITLRYACQLEACSTSTVYNTCTMIRNIKYNTSCVLKRELYS